MPPQAIDKHERYFGYVCHTCEKVFVARDTEAIYECGHCGEVTLLSELDSQNCPKCNRSFGRYIEFACPDCHTGCDHEECLWDAGNNEWVPKDL